MYRKEDKVSYINAVRRLLFIKENGKSDRELFEEIEKMDKNAKKIDYAVFQKIKLQCKRKLKKHELASLYPALYRFPIMPGYKGEDVLLLNSILNNVASYYQINSTTLNVCSYYTQETENAVKCLKEMFCQKVDNIADEEFIYRLICEDKSIRLRKKQVLCEN